MPEQLNIPDLPEPCEWIMGAFEELSEKRSSGMGINPIPFTEIESYQRIYGLQFEPWEMEALSRLDHTFRRILQ